MTLVVPCEHISGGLNDEMKVRLGLTSSASRPDFDDLRPNFTFNDTTDTVSGGNPEAKTEKQQGIDLYYEWYMEPEGFLSVGAFYKEISDFLFFESRPFGSTVLDSAAPAQPRSAYIFNGITNGGDGSLQGNEVFYSQTAQRPVHRNRSPDFFVGFGVNPSGTWPGLSLFHIRTVRAT